MKFSLVIPVAPERDAEIIDSIRKLDYPKSEFHVLVVRGKNPSENRNKGASKARGEIIVFLDDDAVLEKDYLKNAEEFFERHKEIDIVGGPQLTPKDEIGFAQISGYALSSKFGAFRLAHRYSIKKENLNVDETALTSANLLCRKEVMEKIKFEARLFPGEDPKFIEDAKKQGFKVAYSPDIILYHRRRPTIRSMAKQFFNYGKVRPKKESFIKTLEKPYFLVPSIFSIYLISLLLIIMISPSIISSVNNLENMRIDNSGFLFFIPLFVYIILNLLFSAYDSINNKNYKAILFLPFIYFTIHFSYGFGMIYGYLRKLKK